MIAFLNALLILGVIGLLPDEHRTKFRPLSFGNGPCQLRSNSRFVGVSVPSMKSISLTNSHLVALVDDEDFDRISKYTWYLHRDGWAGGWHRESKQTLGMHRLVLNADFVDHRDHDKLNNQKYNLRLANKSTNGMNQLKQKRITSSRYKGVYWNKSGRYWCAYINLKGRPRLHLGCFQDEQLAAIAYNDAASKHFGEFACLNRV